MPGWKLECVRLVDMPVATSAQLRGALGRFKAVRIEHPYVVELYGATGKLVFGVGRSNTALSYAPEDDAGGGAESRGSADAGEPVVFSAGLHPVIFPAAAMIDWPSAENAILRFFESETLDSGISWQPAPRPPESLPVLPMYRPAAEGTRALAWLECTDESVEDQADLVRMLEELVLRQTNRPFLMTLRGDAGMMTFGVGRKFTVLNHMPVNLKPPYYSSRGTIQEEGSVFFDFGGEWTELPGSMAIPWAEGKKAILDFFETGTLSPVVNWQMD